MTRNRLSAGQIAGRSLACALGLVITDAASAETGEKPDILVTGVRAEQPSLDKLTTSVIDTPQAISIVGKEELERRGVDNLGDALRIVPGISLGAGETSWQGNNLILRGFTTRNDTFLDGMRDYGYYFRDPFNSESIEVLKGPGSVLFGRGATGGVVHQVSKTPSLSPITTVKFGVGTEDLQRATVDISRGIGDAAALRINAMGHLSSFADRDGARDRRWGLAPSVALGLGTNSRFFLSWLHQEEYNRPDYGIPWFQGRPAPVSRDSFYGFEDDRLDTNVDIVTAKFEQDLSDAVTFRSQLRWSENERSFRTSEAIVPADTPADAPLSSITVTRNIFSGYSRDRFLQNQTDILARFATGGLQHSLVAGIEAGREMPRPTYIFHEGVITTSLMNPPEQDFSQTGEYVRLRARTSANSLGFYAIDTISLGEKWLVIAGLRWDRFSVHYRSTGYDAAATPVAATDIERSNSKASLRGSVVYKPTGSSSVYLSYADSFNPSGEGIESMISSGRSVGQANVNTDPEKGRIIELGGKVGLLGDRLLVTGSVFEIVKSNIRVPDPLTSGFNINGGRQRARGIEIEAVGQLSDNWSLRASYTYLDTETVRTDNPGAGGAPRVGSALPVAPRHSAVLQTDFRPLPALTLGGGLIYQGSRFGQNTNAVVLRAPGYVIFEARARYDLTDHLTAQLNVFNVGDRLYYDQLHPFHVVPGAGRSALFTLSWTG